MSARRRSPTRWLAPLALLVVAAVAFGIVTSAGDGGGGGSASSEQRGGDATTTTVKRRTTKRRTYVVRSGDTLSAISISTGVPVARLQELNPDLDTQALQPGQRLKLRR